MNEQRKNHLKSLIRTLAICLFTGAIPAFVVSRDTSGYVASMTFFVWLISFIVPLILFLFIAAIVAAVSNRAKHTVLFLLSCIFIPASYAASLKFFEATKIAVYKRDGVDEIRSFETDSSKGWTIIYKKETDYEQRRQFDNEIFFLYESGKGFEKSIVCETSGQLINNYQLITIYFCGNVTEDQKGTLREKLKTSPLIYKIYENKSLDEVKSQNKELLED